MQVDDKVLSQKYNLERLSVISSTQISNRASAVITKLQASSNDGKSTLIALASKARTASKLISIVEIAKRDLATKNLKCFQYNALSSEMTEIERDPKEGANGSNRATTTNHESESEDAFESMEARRESGTKKRLVPVMTTYLSISSVKELKNAYGEHS